MKKNHTLTRCGKGLSPYFLQVFKAVYELWHAKSVWKKREEMFTFLWLPLINWSKIGRTLISVTTNAAYTLTIVGLDSAALVVQRQKNHFQHWKRKLQQKSWDFFQSSLRRPAKIRVRITVSIFNSLSQKCPKDKEGKLKNNSSCHFVLFILSANSKDVSPSFTLTVSPSLAAYLSSHLCQTTLTYFWMMSFPCLMISPGTSCRPPHQIRWNEMTGCRDDSAWSPPPVWGWGWLTWIWWRTARPWNWTHQGWRHGLLVHKCWKDVTLRLRTWPGEEQQGRETELIKAGDMTCWYISVEKM